MKRIIRIILILFLPVFLGSFNLKNAEETYSLTVKVTNLRNSKGVVQFSLYNQDGTIPDEKFKKYFRQKTGKINHHSSTVTFSDLPKGTYAVNILHDEDENGFIKKGFLLPKEGVGFSNYNSIGLSNRPKFSKSSFLLDSDKEISVKIIYL